MTTRSRRAAFALAFGMGALAGGRAGAAPIVSDLGTAPSQFGNFSFSNATPIAVPFTLTTSDTASSAIVEMQEAGSLAPPLSDLSAEILNDNGSGAPGSTVYATGAGGTGTYSTSSANPITFAFSSASLMAPGNYWLEFLVSDSSVNVSISTSSATLSNTGPEGDVGDVLHRGNQTFSSVGGIVEIDNAATPEPGTLGLLAVGAMAQLARRRRRSS